MRKRLGGSATQHPLRRFAGFPGTLVSTYSPPHAGSCHTYPFQWARPFARALSLSSRVFSVEDWGRGQSEGSRSPDGCCGGLVFSK